ncbi:hypothetical protein FTUN_6729 [Frigoriglobus tundricola]|uniref:HEAT repeat domain-containing protein n=1 Tax=Frigoriglobus tundricola TaxID=2774151 RepID=A0A6M5YYN0_9BACT|nr:hypothetical protein FTUN_6729 [Frigoriglobus tundricola]
MRSSILIRFALVIVWAGPVERAHLLAQPAADPKAVKDGVKGLQSPDPRVREAAAEALGGLHTGAGSAVPALTDALRDKVASVRRSAAEALGRSAPKRGPRSRRSSGCSKTTSWRSAARPRSRSGSSDRTPQPPRSRWRRPCGTGAGASGSRSRSPWGNSAPRPTLPCPRSPVR